MNGLNSFKAHVPSGIVANSPEVDKFLDLLDAILDIKRDAIDEFKRSFLYSLVSTDSLRKKYLDEWGAEYHESSNSYCLDCLYKNKDIIYSRKGTEIGLKALLKCLCISDAVPEVTITKFTRGNELILSDESIIIDYIPDMDDILEDYDSVSECPTILGDTFMYLDDILEISIGLDYEPTQEFISFIENVIPNYLPMVNTKMFNLTITFYKL